MQDAADSRCEVGGIRLKGTLFQRRAEIQAFFHAAADRVGLVAVRDDQSASHGTGKHGVVDDQGRIADPCGIERFGADGAVFRNENAVAAVFASAHDEIGAGGITSVLGCADDDAAPDIFVIAENVSDGSVLVNIHTAFSFPCVCACSYRLM